MAGAVGHPDGVAENAVGVEDGFLLVGGGAGLEQAGERAVGLKVHADESFSVGSPAQSEQAAGLRAADERLLIAAAGINGIDHDAVLAGIGIAVADKGELFSVGRESDVGIDIGDQLLGSSAQHGGAIKIFELLARRLATHEVEIIAVRGKRQAEVVHRSRGDDLGVAIGGEIAQPEALLAAVTDYVEDVFAVGRDGGARGLAGFGDFADGDALEGRGPGCGREKHRCRSQQRRAQRGPRAR